MASGAMAEIRAIAARIGKTPEALFGFDGGSVPRKAATRLRMTAAKNPLAVTHQDPAAPQGNTWRGRGLILGGCAGT